MKQCIFMVWCARKKEKKMSKSDPATCIDPLESIQEYGTDALRLGLLIGTGPGQDLRLYPEKLESCRRFVNKIWNAGRYIQMTIQPETSIHSPQKVNAEIAQWLLHQLNLLVIEVQRLLENYRLSDAIDQLRSFFWGELCDWYLEMDKRPQRTAEDDQILVYAYMTLLRLLHPFIPFVTEALWSEFQPAQPLIVSEWPREVKEHQFKLSATRISLVKEAVTKIRTLREKAGISMGQQIAASLVSLTHADLFQEHKELIIRLARLSKLQIEASTPKMDDKNALSIYFEEGLATIDASAVDWRKEIASLQKQLNKEQDFLAKSENKLENSHFLQKAPKKVIFALKEKVTSTQKTISALSQQMEELQKYESAS